MLLIDEDHEGRLHKTVPQSRHIPQSDPEVRGTVRLEAGHEVGDSLYLVSGQAVSDPMALVAPGSTLMSLLQGPDTQRQRRVADLPAHLGFRARSPSPAGQISWAPPGALMFRLIEAWMRDAAQNVLGGQEVVTPLVVDWEPGGRIHDLAGFFDDRLFHLKDRRPQVLRYSADPGVLTMLAGMTPVDETIRLWEIGPFLRKSRRGELRGAERLHSFTMLDFHAVSPSIESASDEFTRILAAQIQLAATWTDDPAARITVVAGAESLADKPIARATELLAGPVLVEVVPEAKRYWRLQSFVFARGPYSLFNLQLDVENAPRFSIGIRSGQPAPGIVHANLASIERLMLVATSRAQNLDDPQFPLWLSPVQVRLLPINESHLGASDSLAAWLGRAPVRCDVDDRPDRLRSRLRRADEDWVPFTVCIGPREAHDGTDWGATRLKVRSRGGEFTEMSAEELRALVTERGRGLPFLPLGYRQVSNRVSLPPR